MLKAIKRSKPIIVRHKKRTRSEAFEGRYRPIQPKDQKQSDESCPEKKSKSKQIENRQRSNDGGYSESPAYQHTGNHGNQSILIVQSVAKDKTFSRPRNKQATRTNSICYTCKHCKGNYRAISLLRKHKCAVECNENKLPPATKGNGSQDSSNEGTSPIRAGGVVVGRDQDGKTVIHLEHDSRGKGHPIAVDMKEIYPSKIVPRTTYMREEDTEVAEDTKQKDVGSRKPAVVLIRHKLHRNWKQVPRQNVQNSSKSNAGTGESDVQNNVKSNLGTTESDIGSNGKSNAVSAVRSAPVLTDKCHVRCPMVDASQTPELAQVENNDGGALQNEEVVWEEASGDDNAAVNEDTVGEKTRGTASHGEGETLVDLFTEDFEHVVSAVDASSCDEVSVDCHPDGGAFSVTVLEAEVKGHSVMAHCREFKEQHGQLKPFRCSICLQCFRSFDRMKRHQKLHMKRYRLMNLRLKKRQKHVVDDKLGPCYNETSTKSKSRWVHKIHWMCEICGKKYFHVEDWQEHAKIYHLRLKSVHKSKAVLHRCLCCRKDFSNMIKFDKHMMKHMKKQATYKFVCRPGKQSKQNKKTAGANLKKKRCQLKKKSGGANLEGESTNGSVPQPIQCMRCMKMFRNVSVASKHIAREHDLVFLPRDGQLRGRYQCRLCQKSFLTAAYLDKHKLAHPEYSTSMDYINVYDLNPNQKQWDVTRPYQCQICFSTFKNSTDAHMHVIIMHESNFFLIVEGKLTKLQCSHCSKSPSKTPLYNSLKALLEHKMNTHSKNFLSGDVLEFKADQIVNSVATMNNKTVSSTSYNKYAETAVSDQSENFQRRNLCYLCGMEFADSSELLSHEKSHEDETPYEESTESQISLAGQEDVISAEFASFKPVNGLFQCVHCTNNPKTFYSTWEASKHVVFTHDRVVLFLSHPKGKDMFRCRYCESLFEDMQALMIHKYTHSTYKTSMDYIQLVTCGNYEDLRLHVEAALSHVNTKRRCKHCNTLFIKDCDISNHILEYHDSLILSNNNGLSTTKVYQCRFCDLHFPTRDGLVKHKKRHKGYMPCMEYVKIVGPSLKAKATTEQDQQTRCHVIINEKEDHSAVKTATTAPAESADTIQESSPPSAAKAAETNLSPTLTVTPAERDIPAEVRKSNSSFAPVNIPVKFPGINSLSTFAAKVDENHLHSTLDTGVVPQAQENDSLCTSTNVPSTVADVAASQVQENKSSCIPTIASIESNALVRPPDMEHKMDSVYPSVNPNSINSFLSDQVKSIFAYLNQDGADTDTINWSKKRP